MTSPEFRVAVVGSGPSGIYATEALLRQLPSARVDVIDRALTPYGLVRHGVAPDHVKIKSVTRVLGRTLDSPRVRWLGNVEVGDRGAGAEVDLVDLRARYHAVVLATGAPHASGLEAPGSRLPGVCTAADLVPWYNGHPDAVAPPVGRAGSVVVVGAGNVALDIARVLLRGGAGSLGHSDLPAPRLEELRRLAVRDVHLVARRGPESVKFGAAELRDLNQVEDLGLRVDPAAFATTADDDAPTTAILRSWAERSSPPTQQNLHFHFRREVARVAGVGAVSGVDLRSPGDGDSFRLPAHLVVAAIGFRGEALPGVPFDEVHGIVRHRSGRVCPGVYVVGWAKRGPSGVIGTNKPDAAETVAALVADADGLAARRVADEDLASVVRRRGGRVVAWGDWLRLDAAEQARGRADGRPRAKLDDRGEMLAVLESVPTRDRPGVDEVAPACYVHAAS